MTALAKHLEFAPPPPADGARSFGLALLVHALLVAALTWGIHWQDDDQSTAVEAELWSAIPTPAAPRAVEPDPPPPAPKVEPEPPPPPPKVTPKPTPPAAQREAQLAIEREKQKKLEQEKKLEEEKQKRKEKEKKEKLEKEKHAKQEKEKLEREKLEKEKLEKEKKEKAKQKAEQDAKERAEAKRLVADRQANLKRIAGMAGATGGPTDTGTALKASGPSASYAGRIRGKVKPNIVFGEDIPGNPTAEVEVKCAPDGTILSKQLLHSSGHKSWDDAVIKALEKTEKLPRDLDGRVPSVLVISFRPKD
mgnify:FL=1